MPADADATPLIDVRALRSDLYRLVVLLLADESVAEVDAFRDLADAHHEAEVNRLLIWVAIAVRQLLDIDDTTSRQTCGRFWPDLSDATREQDLTFREACNKLIHAVEIVPYGFGDDPATIPERARFEGTITIRGRWRDRRTHTVMNFQRFAECCTALSGNFLKD